MDLTFKDFPEELLKASEKQRQCDFFDCCEYGKYNECFSHGHVLCQNYEVYYNSVVTKRKQNI